MFDLTTLQASRRERQGRAQSALLLERWEASDETMLKAQKAATKAAADVRRSKHI
jgi:hypothetical protein